MPRFSLLIAFVCTCAVVAPPAARAETGDVLVRFKATADTRDRDDARDAAGVEHEESLPVPGLERVGTRRGVSAARAAEALERDPAVLYAEPDARLTSALHVDDSLFVFQWGLQRIHAPAAWDVTVGSSSVRVAVLDSGVDLDHPDLATNLAAGYDFVDHDPFPYDGDAEGHGTHVAGIIGAVSDNRLGVAGLNWHVAMVPMRILDDTGHGVVSSEVEAIAAAVSGGARVVNMSYTGHDFSTAEYDAIKAARDTLFVAAAGNGSADNDRNPSYPCAYELPNVLCVTASSFIDMLPAWANVGARSVDLAAPGESIYSTLPHGLWGYMDGTSMAAPYVTGAAALLLAKAPTARPEDLSAALRGTADPVPAFAGRTTTGGRLNVAAALNAIVATPKPPDPEPTPTPTVDPSPTPPPGDDPVVDPWTPGTPSALAQPAQLAVRRATVEHGRLRVLAGMTKLAANAGNIGLTFRANGNTTRLQVRVAAGGKIDVVYQLPNSRHVEGGMLTLTWAGTSTVRPATVQVRAAKRRAALRHATTTLRAGVITATGTISTAARGRVGLSLEYVDGAQVRTAQFSARIAKGRWKLSAPVPPAARAGGFLTTRFAGDAGAKGGALRGEQDVRQLIGS